MDRLISVEEAKNIINEQQIKKKILRVPVQDALGKVLATDLYAPIDIPAFHQSSMDGYAFSFKYWKQEQSLSVTHEIPAGSKGPLRVPETNAARIFTGAALPLGVDTVVKQELIELKDNQIVIKDPSISLGDNVRLKGSEIKEGEQALAAGTVLGPATIGFLCGIGLSEVDIFTSPSVAVIVTGDELKQPGTPLAHGEVYEASSAMLSAALLQMGINRIKTYYAKDNLDDTIIQLQNALAFADVVILTGGVSVGDYDFVVRAAEACEVEKLFHKIKQRPGKPLFFGRKSEQMVFGLPGNPSSVLTCFYEYVWPALRSFGGHEKQLKTLKVPLRISYTKNNQLTHFLKGYYDNDKVTILHAQESYRLRSFAMANCLVVLNEEMKTYLEDELVEIHLIPTYG